MPKSIAALFQSDSRRLVSQGACMQAAKYRSSGDIMKNPLARWKLRIGCCSSGSIRIAVLRAEHARQTAQQTQSLRDTLQKGIADLITAQLTPV